MKKEIDIKEIIPLIKNNVDCGKEMISYIDNYVETKQIPSPIFNALISQRDACAINVMNLKRIVNNI